MFLLSWIFIKYLRNIPVYYKYFQYKAVKCNNYAIVYLFFTIFKADFKLFFLATFFYVKIEQAQAFKEKI